MNDANFRSTEPLPETSPLRLNNMHPSSPGYIGPSDREPDNAGETNEDQQDFLSWMKQSTKILKRKKIPLADLEGGGDGTELDPMEKVNVSDPIIKPLLSCIAVIAVLSIAMVVYFTQASFATNASILKEAVSVWTSDPTSAAEEYGDIGGWRVHQVKDMSYLFKG